MNQVKNFTRGLIKENPLFIMVLGLCPALAVTASAINGLGMGIATTLVLIGSNVLLSLLSNLIPAKVRIPAFIVIIASLVTCLEFIMQAYVPGLYDLLGIFIPLIVVNCLVFGRAEAFASKNNVFSSFVDACGVGLGFTAGLVILGTVREVLGNGSIFDYKFIQGDGILAFVLAPGAFIALGYLIVLVNKIKK